MMAGWSQMMTAGEQVEEGHRLRGEPSYAELQAQRDALLEALIAMSQLPDDWCMSVDDCALWEGSNLTGHSPLCSNARAAIAQVHRESKGKS